MAIFPFTADKAKLNPRKKNKSWKILLFDGSQSIIDGRIDQKCAQVAKPWQGLERDSPHIESITWFHINIEVNFTDDKSAW
jgi:hypothetical protein